MGKFGSFFALLGIAVPSLVSTAGPPEVARLFLTGTSDVRSHPVGSENLTMLYVINAGAAPATQMSGVVVGETFTFNGGVYPGARGTCGSELAPDTECTLEVEFVPGARQGYAGSVRLAYESGQGAAIVARELTGRGISPALLVFTEAPSYNFGLRNTGSIETKLLTVSNVGDMMADDIAMSIVGAGFTWLAGTYPGMEGTCGSELWPGMQCTIDVAFTPGFVAEFTGRVKVSYFDAVAARSAQLNLVGSSYSIPRP